MEIWDLYNEKKEKVVKDCIRGEKIPNGLFHLVVHVWIKNKEGKYLISQRSEEKSTHPLKWECTGGSVIKGENSLEGAIRETKEEVGVELDVNNGKLIFSKIRKNYNDIVDVWLFEYDGEADLENATTKEVKEAKWCTKEEIKKIWDKGELVPTLGYFFDENI